MVECWQKRVLWTFMDFRFKIEIFRMFNRQFRKLQYYGKMFHDFAKKCKGSESVNNFRKPEYSQCWGPFKYLQTCSLCMCRTMMCRLDLSKFFYNYVEQSRIQLLCPGLLSSCGSVPLYADKDQHILDKFVKWLNYLRMCQDTVYCLRHL